MEIQEAIDVFSLTTSNLSPHTQRWYATKLRMFNEWCVSQEICLEHITPKIVKDYISTLTGEPETVHGHAKVVKLFLTWCSQDEEFSEYVKPRTVRLIPLPKVPTKVIETFTWDELAALYTATRKEFKPELIKRDIAILSLLLDTGVRASELCSLTTDKVVISKADSYITVMGKGKKGREIGLGERARNDLYRYIRQYRRGGGPVFLSRFNEPLTTNGLDQILYRLRDWAHLDTRAGAHKFRHTFAVNYLRNGGDVYKLSRLMGHTNVATTERYVRSMQQKEARTGKSVLDSLDL